MTEEQQLVIIVKMLDAIKDLEIKYEQTKCIIIQLNERIEKLEKGETK